MRRPRVASGSCRCGRLGVSTLCLASALGLIASSEASAQTPDAPSAARQPTRTITLIGADKRTLAFDSRLPSGAQVAALNVIVQASAPARGTLDAQLVFSDPRPLQRRAVRLTTKEPTTAAPAAPQLFVTDADSLKLPLGGRRVLGLRVAIGPTSRPGAASGDLLITLRGQRAVAPIVLTVAGQAPQASFAPASAKLNVTRQWGILNTNNWIDGLATNVLLQGPGTEVWLNPAHPRTVEGTLRRDSDHTAKATLTLPTKTNEDGLAQASVALSNIEGPGKYSGDIVLNPASAKPTKLPVEATVRHGLGWPLLFVGVGAIIGGLGVAFQDRRRRRDIVRIALHRAVEQYEAQRRADSREKNPLSSDMYSPDALGYGTRFPKPRACARPSDNWGRVAHLYCDAHAAKDDGELEALAVEAEAVVAGFERWHLLRQGVRGLRLALRRVNPPTDSQVHQESEQLAASVAVEPDAEAATALTERFTRQRRVLAAYGAVQHLYSRLDPATRSAVEAFAPAEVYGRAEPEPERDAAASYVLLLELATAERVMRDPVSAPQPRGLMEMADLDLSQMEGARALFATAPGQRLTDELAAQLGRPQPSRADRRSAATIERGLKRWDLGLFLLTAAVTLLVYTLTLWNDTWGSFSDYVTAFAAGLLGQVAVGQVALNWSLFPSLRSYRLSTPKSAEAAPAPSSGATTPAA